MDVPEIILRVERRQFVRVQAVIPISYYILPENEQYNEVKAVPPAYWKKAKNSFTIDIGAGGVKLVTYEESKISKNAILTFRLNEEIRTIGKVVRIEKDKVNSNYRTAFQFGAIKKEVRN